MMINFGSLVQIGIRDNSLKLCEKERKKKKYFFLSMGSNERKKKKENVYFSFLSFSLNLSELSLIPIWTREPKFIIMFYSQNYDFARIAYSQPVTIPLPF